MNDRSGVGERSSGKARSMPRAWARDTLTIGAIAGFVATIVFVLSDWVLVRLVGLKYGAAWEYASEMFLNIGLVHIPMGRLIGYIGEFGMGTGFGVSVAILLRRSGKDNYLLKGLVAAGVWYTILLAVVPRWLNTATWVFGQPFTILMALKNWILMGIIIPFIVARYAEFAPAEVATKRPATEDVEATYPHERSLGSLQTAFAEFSDEPGELNEKLAQNVDAQSPPEQLDGEAKCLEAELVSNIPIHGGLREERREGHHEGHHRIKTVRPRKKR